MERAPSRRSAVLGAAVIVTVAAALALAAAVWRDGRTEDAALTASQAPVEAGAPSHGTGPATFPASALPPSTMPHERPPPVLGPPALNEAYDACATKAGFAPGGVQVLVSPDGTPEWVKSGRDVPPAVHRPCFIQIGGTDPHRSSWGTAQRP